MNDSTRMMVWGFAVPGLMALASGLVLMASAAKRRHGAPVVHAHTGWVEGTSPLGMWAGCVSVILLAIGACVSGYGIVGWTEIGEGGALSVVTMDQRQPLAFGVIGVFGALAALIVPVFRGSGIWERTAWGAAAGIAALIGAMILLGPTFDRGRYGEQIQSGLKWMGERRGLSEVAGLLRGSLLVWVSGACAGSALLAAWSLGMLADRGRRVGMTVVLVGWLLAIGGGALGNGGQTIGQRGLALALIAGLAGAPMLLVRGGLHSACIGVLAAMGTLLLTYSATFSSMPAWVMVVLALVPVAGLAADVVLAKMRVGDVARTIGVIVVAAGVAGVAVGPGVASLAKFIAGE